MTEVMIVTECK